MNQNQTIETDRMEIDLLELAQNLLRKWWLILLAAIAGMGLMIGYTKLFIAPTYQSQSMLYMLMNTTSVASVADLQIGGAITNDFILIAKSKPTVDKAIEILEREEGIKFTRSDILGMFSIANEEDTRILILKATSTNPEHACMVANAMAEATIERMMEITKKDPPTLVESAEVSTWPIGPNVQRSAMLGFIAGAAVVCVLLLIQMLLNDNIKTEEDVERYLGVATLAAIPYIKQLSEEKAEVPSKIRGFGRGKE